MTWKSDEHIASRRYPDQISRDAARAGYSDGYHDYRANRGDWPVQPYSAAYHQARHDRNSK
jgi:hypothetical protein